VGAVGILRSSAKLVEGIEGGSSSLLMEQMATQISRQPSRAQFLADVGAESA
jgi:hypothetical protein